MQTCISPLKLTCLAPVALFLTARFNTDPKLCKVLCPRCRVLVLVAILLILPSICTVLINFYCALLVSSLAIVVCSSSAQVMVFLKNSSSLSCRRCSVFLMCLRLSCCCWRFCLVLSMALASFVRCTMMCSLSFDSMVGSLETARMEKALCRVFHC